MTLYMLIARQRSGTGALNSILSQNENIICLGEVFHPGNISTDDNNYFRWLNNKQNHSKLSDVILKNDKNFYDYFGWISKKFDKKKIIIDIKYRSLHHFNGGWFSPLGQPIIFRFIKKENIPCIHLTRNNLLETYVSGILAEMNKVWHAKPETTLEHHSLKVDIASLNKYISFTSGEVAFIKKVFHEIRTAVEIDYENLLINNGLSREAVDKLEKILNVSALSKLKTPFIKQVRSLKESIENYDEVRLFLEQHGLGNWLDDRAA